MAKIAVHSRTKARFIEAAVAKKDGGKKKLSWNRLFDQSALSAGQLHSLFSPVTELPRGYTVVDTNHVKKLEKALGAEGELLPIVEKGGKDPKDFTDPQTD